MTAHPDIERLRALVAERASNVTIVDVGAECAAAAREATGRVTALLSVPATVTYDPLSLREPSPVEMTNILPGTVCVDGTVDVAGVWLAVTSTGYRDPETGYVFVSDYLTTTERSGRIDGPESLLAYLEWRSGD